MAQSPSTPHPSRRSRSQDGSVTLGLAVVFPAVLALIVAIMQAALVWHARNLASAAAAEGLRVEQAQDGTAAAGENRARAFLAETSRQLLDDVTVAGLRTAGTASVTVEGVALGVLPGLHLHVHAVATGPLERFVPDALVFTNPDGGPGVGVLAGAAP